MSASRASERKDLADAIRIRLLEQDADTLEEAVGGLVTELRALRLVLTSLLVGVATACVLLAANILLLRGG